MLKFLLFLVFVFMMTACSQSKNRTAYVREYRTRLHFLLKRDTTLYLTRDTFYVSESETGNLTASHLIWHKMPTGWFESMVTPYGEIYEVGDENAPYRPLVLAGAFLQRLCLTNDNKQLYVYGNPEIKWEIVQTGR